MRTRAHLDTHLVHHPFLSLQLALLCSFSDTTVGGQLGPLRSRPEQNGTRNYISGVLDQRAPIAMSGSGESFTLLESGTSRMHFKLAKALEDATSPHESDLAIQDALTQIRTRLASKSSARHLSELVPPLLTLLHCLHHYPSAGQQQEPLDVSFALLPTLQLLSLATDWNDVLLAHQLLPFLLERRPSPLPISPSSSATSRSAHRDEDHSSSLLLLNTFRASLAAALASGDNDVTPSESSPSASSSRSRSRSRSPSRTRPLSTSAKAASSRCTDLRVMETLKSLANGIPQGPAVLPSLASTLVALTRHSDSTIRSLTLDAMLSCASFSSGNQETDADGDVEGRNEMLEAALTIARLVLASTYAFSTGSDIDEQDGVILAEMERRVDPNPGVLRSCLRIIERARMAGLISSNELACHVVEILQATRWLPMHLELKSLQQIDVPVQVTNRTEGLRARAAARQRGPLQAQHNYYGTYAPWLTEACLAALSRCAKDLLASSTPRLEQDTHAELLKSILRIYNSASQGKAAALALCVASARCIGALYDSPQDGSEVSAHPSLSASGGNQDGETAALWSALTRHTRSQLRSTNPNRKAAGIMLLEALLPVGWAYQNTAAATGEAGKGVPSPAPVHMTEEDMAQLMTLLADSDSSIRKRTLGLLHRVDSSLTSLMRTQLQSSVDTELLKLNGTPITAEVTSVALRLLEVAAFSVQSADGAAQAAAESELEHAVMSIMPLNPFGSFGSIESPPDTASSSAFLWQLQALSIDMRLALMRCLLGAARSEPASSGALRLLCTLLADITPSDFRAKSGALDSFCKWSVSELLGSDGIISFLIRASGEARALAAAREAILAITARTFSLIVNLEGSEEAPATLAACLEALQPVLSKLIETESIAAIRLEASNLQLICRTMFRPAEAQHAILMDRIKTMASACQTIANSAKWLLTLELDHTSAFQRKEDCKGEYW